MEQQAQKAVQKTVQYLESNLTDSMENIFTVAAPSDEDMKKLISFVQSGAVDQPVPQEIVQMLQGRKRSDYLIALLAGEAFLAIEHSRPCHGCGTGSDNGAGCLPEYRRIVLVFQAY